MPVYANYQGKRYRFPDDASDQEIKDFFAGKGSGLSVAGGTGDSEKPGFIQRTLGWAIEGIGKGVEYGAKGAEQYWEAGPGKTLQQLAEIMPWHKYVPTSQQVKDQANQLLDASGISRNPMRRPTLAEDAKEAATGGAITILGDIMPGIDVAGEVPLAAIGAGGEFLQKIGQGMQGQDVGKVLQMPSDIVGSVGSWAAENPVQAGILGAFGIEGGAALVGAVPVAAKGAATVVKAGAKAGTKAVGKFGGVATDAAEAIAKASLNPKAAFKEFRSAREMRAEIEGIFKTQKDWVLDSTPDQISRFFDGKTLEQASADLAASKASVTSLVRADVKRVAPVVVEYNDVQKGALLESQEKAYQLAATGNKMDLGEPLEGIERALPDIPHQKAISTRFETPPEIPMELAEAKMRYTVETGAPLGTDPTFITRVKDFFTYNLPQTMRKAKDRARNIPGGKTMGDAMEQWGFHTQVYEGFWSARLYPTIASLEKPAMREKAWDILVRVGQARDVVGGKNVLLHDINRALDPQTMQRMLENGIAVAVKEGILKSPQEAMPYIPFVTEMLKFNEESYSLLKRFHPSFDGLSGYAAPQYWDPAIFAMTEKRAIKIAEEAARLEVARNMPKAQELKEMFAKQGITGKDADASAFATLSNDYRDLLRNVINNQETQIQHTGNMGGSGYKIGMHRSAFLSDGVTPIPGAIKDPIQWMPMHIQRVARHVARGQFFGDKDYFFHTGMIPAIKKAGGSVPEAAELFHRVIGGRGGASSMPEWSKRLMRTLKGIAGFRLLGVKNTLLQLSTLGNKAAINVVAKDWKTAFDNSLKVFDRDSSQFYMARASGALKDLGNRLWMLSTDSVIPTASKPTWSEVIFRRTLKYVGSEAMDTSQRLVGGFLGVSEAEGTLKTALSTTGKMRETAIRKLKQLFGEGRPHGSSVDDMLRRGELTDAEALEAFVRLETKTDFRKIPTEMALWQQGPFASTVLFLQQFTVMQTQFAWDNVFKPYIMSFGKGPAEAAKASARLLRTSAIYWGLGEIISDARATIDSTDWVEVLKGKGSVPSARKMRKIIAQKRHVDENILNAWRMVDSIGKAGAIGPIVEAVNFGVTEFYSPVALDQITDIWRAAVSLSKGKPKTAFRKTLPAWGWLTQPEGRSTLKLPSESR